jgi:hypothetical protein
MAEGLAYENNRLDSNQKSESRSFRSLTSVIINLVLPYRKWLLVIFLAMLL